MKIYTKTGDLGRTSLLSGTKVSKSHARLDAYGTVDELNAHIGLVGDQLDSSNEAIPTLREIQDRLFTLGSELACDPDKKIKMPLPSLEEQDIEYLEKQIDSMNDVLPPQRHFILPGGSITISAIHIARTVCRRAERMVVALQENNGRVDPLIIKYLNRLSDYLFILARYTGFKNNVQEIPWKARVEKE